jgi:hypothetical protein
MRATQTFECNYKKRSKCKAKVCFTLFNNIAKFRYAIWQHNHNIDTSELKIRFNSSTKEGKQILELTKLCVPLGIIRRQSDISLFSNTLFNNRREVLTEMRSESIINLQNLTQHWKY